MPQALRGENRFLFHGSGRVSDGQTFTQILPEEGEDASAPLVLAGMDQLVRDQETVTDKVRANEDAVCAASNRPAVKGLTRPVASPAKLARRMIRQRRNRRYGQESHAVRVSHAHCAGIGQLGIGESDARRKDASLLSLRPSGGEWQKLLELLRADDTSALIPSGVYLAETLT